MTRYWVLWVLLANQTWGWSWGPLTHPISKKNALLSFKSHREPQKKGKLLTYPDDLGVAIQAITERFELKRNLRGTWGHLARKIPPDLQTVNQPPTYHLQLELVKAPQTSPTQIHLLREVWFSFPSLTCVQSSKAPFLSEIDPECFFLFFSWLLLQPPSSVTRLIKAT